MAIVDIKIDCRAAEALTRVSGAVQAQAVKAMRRAVSRTAKWVNSQVSRRVAKATKISAKIIKSRNAIYLTADEGRVWIGLNPIDAKRLNPVQTAEGVQAGPANFPGAFIAQGGKLEGHVFKRRGASRLPIDKQVYAIFDKANPIINAVAREVGAKLLTEFEHELKWQTRSQA